MRCPSASDLLRVWEQSRLLPHWRKALALLALAEPETPPGVLEDLPIGLRDARLFALRERLFGSRLDCLVTCPGCQESLEMALQVADLLGSHPGGDERRIEPVKLEFESYSLAMRPPTSRDLESISSSADAREAGRRLLERCVVSSRLQDRDLPVSELPESAAAEAARRVAQVDALADIQLDLTCPACGHRWPAPFDIVAFFWAEIQAWAFRVFREVHRLALAYGWSESAILTMSPARRRIYLELLDG